MACSPEPCQDSCTDLLWTLLGSLIITRVQQQTIDTNSGDLVQTLRHVRLFYRLVLYAFCYIVSTIPKFFMTKQKRHISLKVLSRLKDHVCKLFSVNSTLLHVAESSSGKVNLKKMLVRDCPFWVTQGSPLSPAV